MNFFSKLAVRSCRDTSPQKLREGNIFHLHAACKKNCFRAYSKIFKYTRYLSKTLRRSKLYWPADPSGKTQGKEIILWALNLLKFKVMPAYMSSLLCDDGIYPHHETATDDRAYLRQKILQMNVKSSCAYFYPCVYPILNTALDPAIPKPSLRCSIERFKQEQVKK